MPFVRERFWRSVTSTSQHRKIRRRTKKHASQNGRLGRSLKSKGRTQKSERLEERKAATPTLRKAKKPGIVPSDS